MQSDLDDTYECPIHKSKTLPPHLGGFLDDSFHAGGAIPRQRSTSSASSRSSSYQEIPGSPSKKQELMEPVVKTRKVRRHSSHRKSSDRHSKLHPQTILENGDFDVRPKSGSSRNKQYENLDDVNRHGDTLEESAGHYQDINDLSTHQQPLEGEPNVADNPFHSQKHRHRPGQKARIFRKYREMHCTSFCDNDISIEYHGKLPKKDSMFSMSRDSGVNCVGLGNALITTSTPSDAVKNSSCVQSQRSSTPVQLNNQQLQSSTQQQQQPNNLKIIETTFNNDSANTITIHHQAQIHCIPEMSQEDSGFNSPRTLDYTDSFNNVTPQYHTKKIDYQHNWTKPKDLIDSKNNQDKARSIDNLHGSGYGHFVDSDEIPESMEGHDLGASGSWSSSSRQTVKEAPQLPPQLSPEIPQLPPLRPWPHPKEKEQRKSRVSPQEDSDAPREGSPTMVSPSQREFSEAQTVREKDRDRSRDSTHLPNGDVVKIKTSKTKTDGHKSHRNHPKEKETGENKHKYSNNTKKSVSKEDKDKVKRNLGDALENLQEGSSRLHHRAFREYHNGKSHGNGVARSQDYEVVGIV